MSQDINRVIIVGRLVRDPEMKATTSGSHFCRFSIASNRRGKDGKEEVGFFDCVAWNKTAETIHKYLKKGSRIAIDGNLRWSSWQGTDGKTHSKVEIYVDQCQFMDSKQHGSALDSGAMSDELPPF